MDSNNNTIKSTVKKGISFGSIGLSMHRLN